MKRIIIDLDDTISFAEGGPYEIAKPDSELIAKLWRFKVEGFDIVINTSRNMRTYDGNLGLITANTLPLIIEWLKQHNVPYDEIYVGKPWCGFDGFYVDDKAIRPKEFKDLSYSQIRNLLDKKP